MAVSESVTVQRQWSDGVESSSSSIPMTWTPAEAGSGNPGVIEATTTAATISFGGIATPYLLIIRNLSASGNLLIGESNSGFRPIATIPPGGVNLISYTAGVTYQYKSSAGNVRGLIVATEAPA